MNNDIKGYRCPNCGSMIPISSGRVLKCECCGSEFEKEHKDIQRIYTTNIDGEDVLIGTRIYGYEMECFKADPEGFHPHPPENQDPLPGRGNRPYCRHR